MDISTTCVVVISIVKFKTLDSEDDYSQVVEMSITVKNSPIQDFTHPDNHIPPIYELILYL